MSDLEFIERDDALRMEPALSCVIALHSPSTGIVDSHGRLSCLEGEIDTQGVRVVLGSDVERIAPVSHGYASHLNSNDDRVATRNLVLAAGPHGAELMTGPKGEFYWAPQALFAKGSCFSIDARSLSNTTYPGPESDVPGVRLLLDLQGRARLDPDIESIDAIGYAVDPARGKVFYAAIRKDLPDLPDDSLSADDRAIRPKLPGTGAPEADVALHGPRVHDLDGLVSLYGIESPGLTASPAIAQAVSTMIEHPGLQPR